MTTVDQILAGWPSTFDTMGDARKMQEMVEYARQLERELQAALVDADRYRWLRRQHWEKSNLFVIAGGKSRISLGVDCPSLDRLDAAIDAAETGGANEKQHR